MKGSSFNRQRFIAVLACALALMGLAGSIWAAAPMKMTQAPGYYRMMVGAFEVTALSDGFIDLDAGLMKNASQAEIKELLARMFVGFPKMRTSSNAYLVNTGEKLVLVEAGAGNVFGPTLGRLLTNLKAAGYRPTQVDAVLITHMHGDHVGGLVDAAGKPVFPRAKVYVAKAESDFWLSEEAASKAPADFQKYFKMARDLAVPFIARKKWKTFADGEEPVPGVKAILEAGHTPGHSAFEVRYGDESFLIMGDLVHCAAVQFARPDVSLDFDSDQKEAVAAREALFKKVAESKELVAGMHLPFPGIGHIRAEGDSAYAWAPVDYSPMPK